MVQGTGPGGTVRAQDVEGFVPSAAAPVAAVGAPPPTPIPGATYTDIPLSNVRKVFSLLITLQFLGHECKIHEES